MWKERQACWPDSGRRKRLLSRFVNDLGNCLTPRVSQTSLPCASLLCKGEAEKGNVVTRVLSMGELPGGRVCLSPGVTTPFTHYSFAHRFPTLSLFACSRAPYFLCFLWGSCSSRLGLVQREHRRRLFRRNPRLLQPGILHQLRHLFQQVLSCTRRIGPMDWRAGRGRRDGR